jgi:hypothetical protein
MSCVVRALGTPGFAWCAPASASSPVRHICCVTATKMAILPAIRLRWFGVLLQDAGVP